MFRLQCAIAAVHCIVAIELWDLNIDGTYEPEKAVSRIGNFRGFKGPQSAQVLNRSRGIPFE